MRVVVQRVKNAKVRVEDRVVSEIGNGLLIFLGIKLDDTEEDVKYLASKIPKLRIFNDEKGKLNLSIIDKNYSCLVVSQFTLYADCKEGNRPSFSNAMPSHQAKILYDKFIERLKACNIDVKEGIFQEVMQVELVNDGPVTVLLDSEKII